VHDGAPSRGRGPRRQTGRRSHRARVHVGVDAERRRVHGRAAGLLRHRPADVQPRRRSDRGADHHADRRDHSGPSVRPLRRHGCRAAPRRPTRPLDGRGRRVRVWRADRRTPLRHIRDARLLQLSSAQGHHHRRGRDDHGVRQPTRNAAGVAARSRRDAVGSGAPPGEGRVRAGRLPAARLQLPHDRHPGRARLRADGSRRLGARRARPRRARLRRAAGARRVARAAGGSGAIYTRLSVVRVPVRAAAADAEYVRRSSRPAQRADGGDGGGGRRDAPGNPRARAARLLPRSLRHRPVDVSQRRAGRSPERLAATLSADDRRRDRDRMRVADRGAGGRTCAALPASTISAAGRRPRR